MAIEYPLIMVLYWFWLTHCKYGWTFTKLEEAHLKKVRSAEKGMLIILVALGIRNSKAVLVLLCRQFKNSPSCRFMIEQAIAHNKELFFICCEPDFKPDGWYVCVGYSHNLSSTG